MNASRDLPPAVARWQLRVGLRRARVAALLTQDHVAAAMDWSSSKVARIESGTSSVAAHDVRALLELYNVTEDETRKSLIQLSIVSRRNVGRRVDYLPESIRGTYGTYADFEDAAEVIRVYSGAWIPELVQTPDYARAIAAHALPDTVVQNENRRHVQDDFATYVLQRQAKLDKRGGRSEIEIVLDETALHRSVGGDEVHIAQLSRLLERCRSGPTLRIVPRHAVGRFNVVHSIILLDMRVGEQVVVTRSPHGAVRFHEEFAETQRWRNVYFDAKSASLSGVRAHEMIESAIYARPEPNRSAMTEP